MNQCEKWIDELQFSGWCGQPRITSRNKVPLVYHAVGRRAFTDPLQCGIKDVEWFRVQNVVDDDGAGPRQLYGIRDETRFKEILRKVLTLFCPAEVRSSFWLPYLRSVTPPSLQLWLDEYEGGVV